MRFIGGLELIFGFKSSGNHWKNRKWHKGCKEWGYLQHGAVAIVSWCSENNRNRFVAGQGEHCLLWDLWLFLTKGTGPAVDLVLNQKMRKFNFISRQTVAVDNWWQKIAGFLCGWIKENTNWNCLWKWKKLVNWGWMNCCSAQGRNLKTQSICNLVFCHVYQMLLAHHD